ncbi:MAG TPA: hypothetical protein VG756_19490 [Pseudonocardiaceae bacterium]|nr:hypothetical protein [Pseudonocardiaceae bacterium]
MSEFTGIAAQVGLCRPGVLARRSSVRFPTKESLITEVVTG